MPGSYLADDLREGSPLVLGDDHGRDQQGPLGPAGELLVQAQDVLKRRGGGATAVKL